MLKHRRTRRANSGTAPASARSIPLHFRDDPLLWAGWLYVQEGMTQHDIAEVMGISRATVNSYLAEARQRGIISLSMEPTQLGSLSTAQDVKRRFGLDECIVVPESNGSKPLIARLGEAAARVLQSVLAPGDTLGVAWGRTVMAIADGMHGPPIPNLSVVQVTGGITATFDFSPELCASRLATTLGARCINITAPAVVSKAAIRELITAEPIVSEQLEIASKVDKLVFGVCTTHPDSLMLTSGLVTPREMSHYIKHKATAALAGRFIDQHGRQVRGELDDRMIGLTLEDVARIRMRIAVAGGTDKVSAILASLRGGYATILVTDAATAVALLNASEAAGEGAAPKRKAKPVGEAV